MSVFQGLDELKQALEQMPAELVVEASHIVEAAANGAAATIKGGYPVRTGELRDGLTVTIETNPFGAVATVKNSSKLAWIWENGTQARHNSIGANRGSMPPGHLFIPTVAADRRTMYQRLKELLQQKGFLVSGDA